MADPIRTVPSGALSIRPAKSSAIFGSRSTHTVRSEFRALTRCMWRFPVISRLRALSGNLACKKFPVIGYHNRRSRCPKCLFEWAFSTRSPGRLRFFAGIFPANREICGSAPHVAPDGIALAGLTLAALLDHPLSLCFHQIEYRVAADADEAVRLEQCLDLLARSPTKKRQAFADRRIFRAGAGILRRLYQEARVELAIHDDEATARPQHTDPFVDRGLRMRQCPQQVTADRQVE